MYQSVACLVGRGFYAMPKTFGEWVAEVRVRRGLNPRQLALKAGITPATISRLENQQVGASREMVIKIADALEVSRTEAINAWLADATQEGGAIEYITDPDEVYMIESYRGINSSVNKELARSMLEKMRQLEKRSAIGGMRAGESDSGTDDDADGGSDNDLAE